MTTFLDILKKYRTQSFSERDKGARFERLMQRFLQTDPLYCNRFRNVWQWGEFPFRSAIEWVRERYAVTTHKDSGIVNDPNLWCAEHTAPAYIVNLLLRVIDLSRKSVAIVKTLPKINF